MTMMTGLVSPLVYVDKNSFPPGDYNKLYNLTGYNTTPTNNYWQTFTFFDFFNYYTGTYQSGTFIMNLNYLYQITYLLSHQNINKQRKDDFAKNFRIPTSTTATTLGSVSQVAENISLQATPKEQQISLQSKQHQMMLQQSQFHLYNQLME